MGKVEAARAIEPLCMLWCRWGLVMSGRHPLIKGFFCGVAVDRGCGHVFGLLMRVMTPVGPDVVR